MTQLVRWAVLGALLLVPVGVRAQAAAGDGGDPDAGVPAAPAGAAGPDAFDPTAPLDDETLLRLFRQAQQREKELARREEELVRREERLRALRADIEARYQALRMVQEELRARFEALQEGPGDAEARRKAEAEARAEREANIRRLSKVFEKMRPEEAAKVVPEMDEDLVVTVLLRIKDRQAAKILGGVEPTLAARLSEKMAEKRKERRR